MSYVPDKRYLVDRYLFDRGVVRSRPWIGLCAAALVVILFGGCDTDVNPLAPYEGDRPLIIQDVTISHSPDIAWVGGRAAAVGINRGEQAALDETLVWIYTADGNELESPIYVRDVLDEDVVNSFGGTPTDSLADDEIYTFWIAEAEAFESGLSGGAVDRFSLADTTFQLEYLLNGPRPSVNGGLRLHFDVNRDQRLLSEDYTVRWEPAVPLRTLAIRVGTTGGFSNLIWHIVTPEEEEPSLTPPIVLGDEPDDAQIAVEWDGFGTDRYVLWGANDEWNGQSFTFVAPGYSFFQITHFYEPEEEDDEEESE